jgi:hypothetical protein
MGGKRGFSLTPTRVKSGKASHHSARRGFPSKYEGNIQCANGMGKGAGRGGS